MKQSDPQLRIGESCPCNEDRIHPSLRHAAAKTLVLLVCCLVAVGLAWGQASTVRVDTATATKAVKSKVSPQYPEMAKKMKLTGKVELDAVIDETGKVESVKTVSGNPLLTGAARDALKRWKFTPIEQKGKPVKAVALFAFNFQL